MDTTTIKQKFELLRPTLSESGRRLWAAAEAIAIGYGGTRRVHEATGIARHTIRAGIRELTGVRPLPPPGKERHAGSGRRPIGVAQPGLLEALNALVEPGTRGDPMSALRWTTKSLAKLAEELVAQGYSVSPRTIGTLLKREGYSLQSTQKRLEGKQHIDRDQQFRYIHEAIEQALREENPVISVDAKKKELIGDFAARGQEWQPKGQPVPVRVHDFVDPVLGKVNPYGAYDIFRNEGWVSVGTTADTGEFATATIGRWWANLGASHYPNATRLLVTADGGGSNGVRLRAWKVGLQVLADELNLPITVHHLPPGTSKWNKIEHRMFNAISLNWRGRPLETVAMVVDLISNTTNKGGLKVYAAVDDTAYAKGQKYDDDIMAALNIKPHAFHPEWNYTIYPMSDGPQAG